MSFLTLFGNGSFTGLDKKEYTVSNLSVLELANYVSWVQYKPYRDALAADLSKDLCESILKECKTGLVEEEIEKGKFEKFPISLSSTVVTQAMVSDAGGFKLLHLGTVINHPELRDINEFNKILDIKSVQENIKKALEQNGLVKEVTEEEQEKN